MNNYILFLYGEVQGEYRSLKDAKSALLAEAKDWGEEGSWSLVEVTREWRVRNGEVIQSLGPARESTSQHDDPY